MVIVFFGFLSQILFVTVNYKRDVLEQYVHFDGLDDDKYIFNIGNIPQISQSSQLAIIFPKNLTGDLQSYKYKADWKKERRKGSNESVLNKSIEKNSINFWWVRVFHWDRPFPILFLSMFMVLVSICCLVYMLGYYLNKANE